MKLIASTFLTSILLLNTGIAKEISKPITVTKNVIEKKSENQNNVRVYTTDNSEGNISTKSIEETFKKAGFFISSNRDMNTPFKKQFKESSFDIYNLFTFYKKDVVLELAKKYPNIGLFAPMSMSIYTKKGEKTISISTLSVGAMQNIMNIPSEEKLLTELSLLVEKTIKEALPEGHFEKLPYTKQEPKGALVTTYTMEIDNDDWEDELDEFKMGFEGELAPNGFVIAGQNNLGDDFEEADYEGYDFYEVYSICKLPIIYTIAKIRPEAGAFAPCSLYLNKKKDESKMTIGFPSVYNWMSSLAIEEKKNIEILEDAQQRIKKILTELSE